MAQKNESSDQVVLQLRIQCANVVKTDFVSESDPFVRVFMQRDKWYHPQTGQKLSGFIAIGQTEHIYDNPDPIFQKTFLFEHIFEQSQILKFECWDFESNNKHKLIGVCKIDVARLLRSPGSLQVMYLLNPKTGAKMMHEKRGNYQTLMACLNKVQDSDNDVIMQFRPLNMTKIYNKWPNVYFKIYRKTEIPRANSNPARNEQILLFNRRNKYNTRLPGNMTGVNTNDDPNWILWNFDNEPIKDKRNKKKTFGRCWPALNIKLQQLCQSQQNLQAKCIVLEVWNANKSEKFDDLVGRCEYSLAEMIAEQTKNLYYTSQNGAVSKRGEFAILQCYVVPSLVDFIQAGTNISMICGIDFTQANGEPATRTSLHHIIDINNRKTQHTSQYEECIAAMAHVLTKYDNDKQIPMFGFGLDVVNGDRKEDNSDRSSVDCVDLNLINGRGHSGRNIIDINGNNGGIGGYNGNNRSNMYDGNKVGSIEEMGDVYGETVKKIMDNPGRYKMKQEAKFSDVLARAMKGVNKTHNDMIETEDAQAFTYHVLILMTAGAVAKRDQQRTIDIIVDAANIGYPISIIIIGIGDANFGFLEKLDADKNKLKDSKGRKMERDIVQFVKFEKYRKTGDIHNLAQETLKEVPRQFLSYVLKHQHYMPQKLQPVASSIKPSIKMLP